MDKPSVTFLRAADGQVRAVRIDGIEIPVRLGAPADIDGTLGAQLFVEAGGAAAVARIGTAEFAIHRLSTATIGGVETTVLGIRDAEIAFETRA